MFRQVTWDTRQTVMTSSEQLREGGVCMHERKEDLFVPHKEMEVTEKNRCRVRKRPTCRKSKEER